MSYTYVRFILRSALPRPKKLVCVAIADHVDKLGEGCYVSYSTLADETSYEERQVKRIVAELEQDGIIVYQGLHPKYGTNVWNIDKGKLPKRAARKKRAQEAVVQPLSDGNEPEHAGQPRSDESEPEHVGQPHSGETEMDDAAIEAFWASIGDPVPENVTSGDGRSEESADPGRCNVTLESDISGRKGVTFAGSEPGKMSPNPSSEKGSGERERKGPGGKQPLPPAMDARVNPAAKTRTMRERADSGTYPDETDEIHARDRPETDLQAKVAQLTHSRYLSVGMKTRLRNGVTAAWKGSGSKVPITHPSPEDEWAAHPELFAEYVELCARRAREESGRPPSRDKLITAIRNYARHNTGWLDFKQAAQEERRANPPPKERPLYYDPNKPSWLQ